MSAAGEGVPHAATGGPWWSGGVLYQAYPRSFADSDGDGTGDLAGIASHLDHLAWLGVDGIWMSPIMPSPNTDWGYDISDYYGVHPDFGTLDDLDALVHKAGDLGLAVLLDLVPNHTSDRHPWFAAASGRRDAPMRDYYVWADPTPGGAPPNNWVDSTGSCAWELEAQTGQLYLHNFLRTQPDLNWWNPAVRGEFERILAFWFDRGIAGFRIEVAHGLVKDALLRDNPPARPGDDARFVHFGTHPVYNANRPEVHQIYRSWRRIADRYEPRRALVGETWVGTAERLAAFYGDGHDELDLGFNFPFLFSPFTATDLADVVWRTQAALPKGATPVWTGSNHDVSRMATRWGSGEPARSRLALLVLLALPGTATLYYGDEIGMTDVDVPPDRQLDRMRIGSVHGHFLRDRARTPMQWEAGPGAGFSTAGRTWLPIGDASACNVADQRSDRGSMLWLCHDLIAYRKAHPLRSLEAYRPVLVRDGLWVWRRGARRDSVALNVSERPVVLEGVAGEVIVGTHPRRRGSRLDDGVTLDPWEGVVSGG